jgi:putative NADPH-quinone reductase
VLNEITKKKKIFIVFGHHNTKTSFNASIRDTFISEAIKYGHEIDLINLFEEKKLPFYNSAINSFPKLVLEYRKRLEKSDVMFLIGSCHNLRLNSILENWIDWVLHPTWFFSYRSMFPESKFFRNYGYPVPGAMKNKLGIVSITYGGPMISYFNFSFFDNIPYRRVKKSVFKLGGLKTKYLRFYSVLPNMSQKEFDTHMEKVKRFVLTL